MRLIVGLGNPGKEYERTRHNLGWAAVTHAAGSDMEFKKKKDFQAEIAETIIDDEKVLFVHPLTFMNLSGQAVQSIQSFYKIKLPDILIVQDEMDLPVGTLSFLAKGGDAGHQGIISIQQQLGTKELSRLRLGIGRPIPPLAKEEYVLQPFSSNERVGTKKIINNASNAIHDWIVHGLDKAMNTWNGV